MPEQLPASRFLQACYYFQRALSFWCPDLMTTMPARSRNPRLTQASTPTSASVRPFLKWAGGKRQLLAQLARFHPPQFGAYFEPFLGSGALFFDLYRRGRFSGRGVVLMDNNPDLIGCWLAVRNDAERVIRSLRRLADAHRTDPGACYYRVRDQRFNPIRRRLLGARHGDKCYPPSLAAMLIYLNRTGFNGLFRLNKMGGFNVPLGQYDKPLICDAKNLRHVSSVLRRSESEVCEDRFEAVCRRAVPGDFIYFDPPYAPLSPTSFRSYTSDGFTSVEQRELQQVVIKLARRGCHVLLSNSTAAEVKALYVDNLQARSAGLRAHRVSARRSINAHGSGRGYVDEYLITNIPPQDVG